MTSPVFSRISKTLLPVLFIACLAMTPTLIWAQDYSEEDYNLATEIAAEKDLALKTDKIVKFIKEKPQITKLKDFLTDSFHASLAELQKEKQFQKVINLGEKFITVAPNDNYTIVALAAAYGQTQNLKGFTAFGEKAYASQPTGPFAKAIASAYKELGNEAKYIQWAEKAIAQLPDDPEMLSELTSSKAGSGQMAQAVKYAKLCLAALPNAKKPEGKDAAAWKNSVSAMYAISYGVIGQAAYENRNYTEAIANLDNAVKHYKRNERAYYCLGLCYWQKNQLGPAMLNFAKAYLIKGSTAASAKTYLEKLWKAGHQGKLAGINRIYEQAGQDLK